MEKKGFKSQKKKSTIPVAYVPEGINKKFLITLNEYLFLLLSETKRKSYIDKYTLIQEPLEYLSPLYFASAIAFLDKNPNGPNPDNFNDSAVNQFVNKLFTSSNTSIALSTLKLRRKIEFLRYIRLLMNINDKLPEY
jgi:hypothetical protein